MTSHSHNTIVTHIWKIIWYSTLEYDAIVHVTLEDGSNNTTTHEAAMHITAILEDGV